MKGLLVARTCIVIASLLDIIPGIIHLFTEDGGAGSIAGIVLEWDNSTTIEVDEEPWNSSTYHKETILVLFAGLGLMQIKLGVLTMGGSILLPEGRLLNTLVLSLLAFQVVKIILDLFGYRHIHSIAPYAPGGYKPYLVVIFYIIAAISIWFCRANTRQLR